MELDMSFVKLLIAILFGIVEGITEWLPISSTGHMILLNEFLSLGDDGISDEFVKLFMVVIQLGAILAAVVIYWKKLWPFCTDRSRHYIKKESWQLWFHILVSCIPFGIMGVLFDDVIEDMLGSYIVVAVTLIIYGIVFIVIEKKRPQGGVRYSGVDSIPYLTAFFIGCIQVLAMIPGTSRSGVSIIGAMLLGCSRVAATEYSFFLAIPAMAGSSLFKLLDYGFNFTGPEIAVLIIGMFVAFFVSYVSIKLLVGYVKKHSFIVFGKYRIVLGVLVLAYFTLTNLLGGA